MIVDPGSHFLYRIQGDGQRSLRRRRRRRGLCLERFGRYPHQAGMAGLVSAGGHAARKPELREHMTQLQSGLGMKGGPDNPLGARAMYLWQNNKDTLYRLHGTNDPTTIGHNVSSGCIRLTNDDIADLYNRTAIGTKVIGLATAGPPPAAAQSHSQPGRRPTWGARTCDGITVECWLLRADRDRVLDRARLRVVRRLLPGVLARRRHGHRLGGAQRRWRCRSFG